MRKSVPFKIQVLYGIGVSYAIVDQIFSQWVMYYYLPPESSGLKPLLPPLFISLALVFSRFIDMIFDPIIGHWSDNTNSRWGRRSPFVAAGAIPLAIFTILFFFPIKTSTTSIFISLSLVGALFFIFYTVVGAPYNAIIPEIGHTRNERLNLSTWQSVFRMLYTAVAMITPGILIKLFSTNGDTELGIRKMVILLSLFSIIGAYVCVFTINEKKYSISNNKEKTNFKDVFSMILKEKNFLIYLVGFLFFFIGFNTLRASINYYVEDIMGLGKGSITVVSAILFGASAIFFYPTNRICKKFGYRKIMLVDLVLLMVFSLGLFSLGKLIPIKFGFVIFALIGIPLAGAAFIFPPAMVSEIATALSKKYDLKIDGIAFGIQGFFLKLAFLISILVLPLILVAGEGSLIESMVKIPENISRNGIYFTAIFSTICFAISFVFYFIYKEIFVDS